MDFSKYVVEGQMNIYDFLTTDRREIRVTKPIRTIELFAGYGSQAMFSQLGIPGVKKWNEIHSEEVI